jgi:hypothetical protein
MKCSEEILEVRINKQLDPDRSQLRHLLVDYQRMSTARYMLVHLLAFVGVVIWLEAISPDLLPKEARFFTFILWGSFLFLTLWVAVEEYVLWRKITGYMVRKGGVSSGEN